MMLAAIEELRQGRLASGEPLEGYLRRRDESRIFFDLQIDLIQVDFYAATNDSIPYHYETGY